MMLGAAGFPLDGFLAFSDGSVREAEFCRATSRKRMRVR
jgi:hypothetical protein